MEKRKHPRIDNSSIIADISDGLRFFSGQVTNLSRFGLCIEGIPPKIDHRAKRISVVLSGKGSNFKMITRPCWSWQENKDKMIGLEILNAPWSWTEFVMKQEPVGDDPWDGTAF